MVLGPFLTIEGIDNQEDNPIGDGLVELARMARVTVILNEDESPRHI
jgi:hypothetical protein